MAQAHLEVFPSEYHMLQFFGKYLPKLDVDASGRLAPFLYAYDGELVLARNLYEFLTQIEKMTALGINTLASVQKGRSYLVFFDDKPKTPEKFLENISEINAARENIIPVEKKEEVVIAPLVQTTIIDPTQEVKEPVEENTEQKVETRTEAEKAEILEKAESFRDDSKKAAGKSELEAFALTHGISLSKAKTFDAMLEDLKAGL